MLDLIPLIIGVFLAQISPGPNLLATASAALAGGRRDGLWTASGIATGVFTWAILFSVGVGALLAGFPALLIVMKLVGGGISRLAVLPVGIGVALSALVIYGGYALVFSTDLASRGYARAFRPIEAALGAIFGLIGGQLALQGLRDIR